MIGALLSLVVATSPSGLGAHGEDLLVREKAEVKVSGFFRVRGDLLHNLDLDRGTTPSGLPLFSVPLSDPLGQDLALADMRLRTDLAIYAPFAAAAVKVRADLIDNLVLGSTPVLSPGTGNAPTPAASPGQLPSSLFRIKRAYGEVLTPIGYFAAGRMGNQWGLGMLSNGGDCLDCNHGDAADRLAFVTALGGHLWAVAYDFSAVGPTPYRRDNQRQLVLDNALDVKSVTFAWMNVRDDVSRRRRTKAGKMTFEYGAFLSHRWQDFDAPETYLPVLNPRPLTPASVMRRGYRALAADAWARLTAPSFRVELEGAMLFAESEQASLLPGVLLRDKVQSAQFGAALETQFGANDSVIVGGLNAGYASGDPAPGFGAFPTGNKPATAGELDGAQVNVPRDNRVDNFRFNPDYRVDRILWAEIIGTVTDSLYVRPWGRLRLLDFTSTQLNLKASGTLSRSIYAQSTPNNDALLGFELHGALAWESKDGFDVLAEYAVLFPFGAFNNPSQNLTATPAQLGRVRLAWKV
ncbi:MAG: TIGR04551 family protein [Archangium sp.]|nr:TIGR04551 family protein [Archangium sp.]